MSNYHRPYWLLARRGVNQGCRIFFHLAQNVVKLLSCFTSIWRQKYLRGENYELCHLVIHCSKAFYDLTWVENMHERLLLQYSNSATSFEQDTRFWLHTVTAGNVTWGWCIRTFLEYISYEENFGWCPFSLWPSHSWYCCFSHWDYGNFPSYIWHNCMDPRKLASAHLLHICTAGLRPGLVCLVHIRDSTSSCCVSRCQE